MRSLYSVFHFDNLSLKSNRSLVCQNSPCAPKDCVVYNYLASVSCEIYVHCFKDMDIIWETFCMQLKQHDDGLRLFSFAKLFTYSNNRFSNLFSVPR